MREWWANVYNWNGVSEIGHRSPTRQGSAHRLIDQSSLFCRIHVRLKPEGAQRRYADGVERAMWERYGGREWSQSQIAQMARDRM